MGVTSLNSYFSMVNLVTVIFFDYLNNVVTWTVSEMSQNEIKDMK